MKLKNNKQDNSSKDPVQVYCRLRPLENLTDVAAVKRYSDKIVQLCHPSGNKTEAFYNFKFVFPDDTNQKKVFDEVSLPLVQDLLNGKDGLLFTYGITSSGKTFTLTGNYLNPGVLPRTLDVIFNTIDEKQAKKFIFKQDGQNYFEINSNANALIDLQNFQKQIKQVNFETRTPTRRKNNNNSDEHNWETRLKDDTKCEMQEENDNRFSVFISFVEIYNNYIYDLLDDSAEQSKAKSQSNQQQQQQQFKQTQTKQQQNKQPQSKQLREDMRGKVFVTKGVEIEVKSADEATEIFIKGIKRRSSAHTALNAESSRSHSVFNIKIVQAPVGADGEVVRDSKFMTVSQLSLVDLAGSERVGRTKTTGDRLREASSINNSLMALRNCIDILRENQRANANKKVPYRDNKLTHLFKSYFEGQGSIKMIICVNPSADNYDETIHVMKFAEATQEVMVKRASNIQFAKYDMVNFNLNVHYPNTDFNDMNDEKIFPDWFTALDERKKNRDIKLVLFKEKAYEFRSSLAKIDDENLSSKKKLASLDTDLNIREQQIKDLEKHCGAQQSSLDAYSKKMNDLEFNVRDLENELTKSKFELQQKDLKFKQLQTTFKEKHKQELNTMKTAFKRKLKSIMDDLEYKDYVQKEKKQMVMDILESESLSVFKDLRESIYLNDMNDNRKSDVNIGVGGNLNQTNVKMPANDKSTPQHQSRFELARGVFEAKTDGQTHESRKRPAFADAPVANPKHKRSLSSGNEKWIDHRPKGTIDLGTVFTPSFKNKKSVSKLRKLSSNELINASKYALTHHEQDENGSVETQIYTADIIPTSLGGAQVNFKDIEILRQTSPKKNNLESYDIGIKRNG